VNGVGFSVHTGWAVAVVLSDAPALLLKGRIEMAGDPDRFAFHAAAGLPIVGVAERAERPPSLAEARRIVKRAEAAARAQASAALGELLAGLRVDVAALAPDKPLPAFAEILKRHPRVHAAEGVLYATAIAGACADLGLRVARIAPAAAPALGKVRPP
jgi:hypothetical protein